MSLSHPCNASLIRITKSIEYNVDEDEYFVTSFKTGEKYIVFRLNKIWVCSCKSFLFNKERVSTGCKHTQRIDIVDFARKLGIINIRKVTRGTNRIDVHPLSNFTELL
jgi:hypothetical protein